MKLIFVHDHPFFLEDNITYSGGGLPASTWDKYLINFPDILIFGRRSYNTKDKKIISTKENVSFHLTSNYSSIKNLMLNYSKLKEELTIQIKKTDLVLVRLPSVLGIIAAQIALKHKKKIWVEQVGNGRESFLYQGSLFGKISAFPFDIINKRIVKRVDFISYVTETKLQKDYPASDKAFTVSLSNVIINKILKNDELNLERFTSNRIKIGLIGGFDTQYKGQDILLKSIDLLDDEMKTKIDLYFVGKGDSSKLVEFAKQLNLDTNIKFIGSLKAGDEINLLLKDLSLYVQPSLTEGMPRATIEAMSMGCPVIGSKVGGIPDIVNPEFIHDRGNYRLLSDHIAKLFNDRYLLVKEAFSSLIKAEPYQYEKLNEKRIDFYSKMNKSLGYEKI